MRGKYKPNVRYYNQIQIPDYNTGHFIMFSVITNIYNRKTKGHTLMELFTTTGKLIFFNTK